jgi:hypothetical protein
MYWSTATRSIAVFDAMIRCRMSMFAAMPGDV